MKHLLLILSITLFAGASFAMGNMTDKKDCPLVKKRVEVGRYFGTKAPTQAQLDYIKKVKGSKKNSGN